MINKEELDNLLTVLAPVGTVIDDDLKQKVFKGIMEWLPGQLHNSKVCQCKEYRLIEWQVEKLIGI